MSVERNLESSYKIIITYGLYVALNPIENRHVQQ